MTIPLIIDDDGNNFFHQLTDDHQTCVRELITDLPASVTDYMLCAGAGTFYYPTRIARTDPRMTKIGELHARGADPFDSLLTALKSSGRRTFVTCRMNDVHNPTDADEWNMPLVRKRHPDAIVDMAAVQAGKAEWMSYCLDYSRGEVREYFLSILSEIVGLYHAKIDGLQLDWMRFPRHLSGTPEEVWEKRNHLTAFTASVREMMRRIDPRLKLSVRVPAHASGCKYVGLDVPDWVAGGIVDQVVMCPFLTTEFSPPVEEMREWIGGDVPLYAGHDFQFGTQNHNPESLRGVAATLLDCGADGVYVFNFPCWIEYLAARPWHWLTDLPGTREKSAKPMLVAVGHTKHRMRHVDPPALLPLAIPRGASREVNIRVPGGAMPPRKAVILVQSGGDVGLTVNGHTALRIPFVQDQTPVGRAEIFVEHIDPKSDTSSRPSPGDCCVFKCDPAWLRAGMNLLTITNASEQDRTVARVNLGLW